MAVLPPSPLNDPPHVPLRQYVESRLDVIEEDLRLILRDMSTKEAVDHLALTQQIALEARVSQAEKVESLHIEAHKREHEGQEREQALRDEAIKVALDQRKMHDELTNKWREQLVSERSEFARTKELVDGFKRIEDVIMRVEISMRQEINSQVTVLAQSVTTSSERLRKVEDFVLSAQSQMNSLRTLMVVITFLLLVAGFVLSRIGL